MHHINVILCDCIYTDNSIVSSAKTLSKCEQTRRLRMISFAIWRGQWTPRCYPDGRFQPKQCDNTGT